MTTSYPVQIETLGQLAPFNLLSPPEQTRLLGAASLQRFEEGDPLRTDQAIGERVLVLLEGEASGAEG